MIKFAERLRELRREKGVTQLEMANFMAVSYTHLTLPTIA